jgi:hydrogenase-4 component F
MMPSWPAFVILAPWAAAIALAVLPWRDWHAWVNFGAASLGFLLACRLPFVAGEPGFWLRADPLAIHLVLLTSFVGLTAAWFSRFTLPPGLSDRLARQYHALFQFLLGSLSLALLSDNAALTWVALEAATLALVLATALTGEVDALRASWRVLLLAGAGIALASFGTLLLYLAAVPALGPGWAALRWSVLLPAAAQCDGSALSLAFIFLLLGYGTIAALVPLHAWLIEAQSRGMVALTGVLSGSLPGVGLFVILRLRGLLNDNAHALSPGGPIMALGLASLLVGGFALWRQQGLTRFLAVSTIGQSGLVAFSFGLGGAAATFAGLLHLTVHTLVKAASFQTVTGHGEPAGLLATHRAAGLTLVVAMAALAGMPPFGLFTSLVLVVEQTVQRLPLLAVPVGIGLVASSWALLVRLPSYCFGSAGSDQPPIPLAGLAGAWASLAMALVLGLAMPAGIAAWLQGIAAVAR